jgi:hypothetical protein
MMVRRWFRRDESPPPAPARRPVDEVPMLRETLRALIRRVNASAGKMPVGAVPQIRDIEDRLRELLDQAELRSRTSLGFDTYAAITLAATVNDYLPTSVDSYLVLPEAYLASHRNHDGQTPGEELLEQLDLIETGVTELLEAVYSGEAQRLSTQGRFLEAKFAKTDLDL